MHMHACKHAACSIGSIGRRGCAGWRMDPVPERDMRCMSGNNGGTGNGENEKQEIG